MILNLPEHEKIMARRLIGIHLGKDQKLVFVGEHSVMKYPYFLLKFSHPFKSKIILPLWRKIVNFRSTTEFDQSEAEKFYSNNYQEIISCNYTTAFTKT